MSQHHPLTTLLASQPFVLLDGAMATELEAYGCDLADPLWSAKAQLHPGNYLRDAFHNITDFLLLGCSSDYVEYPRNSGTWSGIW